MTPPARTHAWLQQAMALHRSGDVAAAEPLYRQVIAAAEGPGQADFMLGVLLMQTGRAGEAVVCFRAVTSVRPELADAQSALGEALMATGDPAGAEAAFSAALAARPDDPELVYKWGVARFWSGDVEGALARFERSLQTGGKRGPVLREAGRALSTLVRLEEAQDYLQKAAELLPDDPVTAALQVTNYRRLGKLDEALLCANRILDADPENPEFLRIKAELLEFKGAYNEAYDLLAPRLKGEAALDLVIAFGLVGRHGGRQKEAAALLEAALARGADTDSRRQMHFRAGFLYDRLGEYDRAFSHFQAGNNLSGQSFDRAAFTHKINRLIRAFDPATISRLPRLENSSDVPVFVVGMPRSGTSLVEQIIASHPKAAGAGELTRMEQVARNLADPRLPLAESLPKVPLKKLEEEAAGYLSYLTSFAPDALRVTDKMPLNFLHLGLINLLFPNARAVHLVRDPMDTCLSCYFQDFDMGNVYTADLEDLGHTYREYQRLMAHWKKVLDLPILDVVYEDLVADQEDKSREIIRFIGLPWDDACLRYNENKRVVATASYDQVKRPIYKDSVARWRRFEKHLGPLQKALQGGVF